MCGRYTLSDPGDLVTELGVETSLELRPRYNVAPTQDAAVVRAAERGGRELVLLRWGLVPFWAKELAIGNRMINARAETVAEKPSFKGILRRRRCAVLADGFYEWKKLGGGKQPFHIHLADRRPFVMAGLWDRWSKGPEGPVETFTIITTSANDKVRELHDRMPVILGEEEREAWLDPTLDDPRALVPLLRPAPDDEVGFFPVSRLVNSPKNDVRQCLDPVEVS